MSVEELRADRCDALLRFFAGLPEGDLTFIKEEVTDPETVRSWATGDSAGGRWVAVGTATTGGCGAGVGAAVGRRPRVFFRSFGWKPRGWIGWSVNGFPPDGCAAASRR